ncbi:MAG: chemotaxis protein CheB, partial [Desulfurivibrionaceae bacterium]
MTAKSKKHTGRTTTPEESESPPGKTQKSPGKSRETGESTRPEEPNDIEFPIVGIGASAGGLEALEEFFGAVPADCGIAFVVVTHLAPDHTSILPELIGRKTGMEVMQVKDGIEIAANRVYVIPPNKEMAIINTTLQLLELSKPRGINLPVDTFLRSLAKDLGNKAIGIILSGTGTDGTLGVRAIKGEAGMVMAQDSDSAKYDGMPQSAISTGLVDFVLAPAEMPEQLLSYVRHHYKTKGAGAPDGEKNIENYLPKIFILLRAKTGHDFSLYKKNTINRRIERRMHLHQIDDISEYFRYLRESDSEAPILFKELLIGVTSFFRDADAFELLKEKYLPDLLRDKPYNYQVRIWAPSCSTGEEAYSLAIVMAECMEELERDFKVNIFGTDLDEDAIAKARSGLYPESIAADVSAERLKKFFTSRENHYRINKNIRDMVVFAPQNLIKDPPFTKLDLLCCRNVLIYFVSALQKKIIPLFHYSLKPEGILFLGSSENIGQFTDLFSPLDTKWKIFKRLSGQQSARQLPDFVKAAPPLEAPEKAGPETVNPPRDANTMQILKGIISQGNMPVSVVVDDAANIVYIHGRTGRFLEPAEGEVSNNLLKMAKPGLRTGLSKALRLVNTDRQQSHVKGLRVKENGSSIAVNLTVKPLPVSQAGYRGMALIMFEEVSPDKGGKTGKQEASGQEKSDQVKSLEDELHHTREDLRATIEELETSNEELESNNEELQSINEELQSTNEELETSKEELHSLNEESVTLNTELQTRIEQLTSANTLLESAEIATIFLDSNLRIKRFTPKVLDIFPLTPTDEGRPINHFASNLRDCDLRQYTEKVLNDLQEIETEIRDKEGKTYRMRVRPFRTSNNVIDGVVITFVDITDLKKLLDKEKRLAAVVRESNDAITLQDLEGNIIAWNKGAEKMFGYSETEALKKNILDIVPPERHNEIRELIAKQKSGKNPDMSYLMTER